ncbi:hypothetical protein DRO02_05910 [archaeon]|nr:MAG: hypothetical protein DRO02_05910 [archaeon]
MQAQYISYLIILMITITIIGLLITGFANTWQEWEQTQHYYQIINNIQRICDLFDAAITENKSKVAYINMPEMITMRFYPVRVNNVSIMYSSSRKWEPLGIGPVIGTFHFKTGIILSDVGTTWQERGEWSFFTYVFPKSLLHACTEYDGTKFSLLLSLGIDVDMPNSSTLVVYINFPRLVFSLTETSKSIKSFRISISVRQQMYPLEEYTADGPQDVMLKIVSEALNVSQIMYLIHVPEGDSLLVKVVCICTTLEVSFD